MNAIQWSTLRAWCCAFGILGFSLGRTLGHDWTQDPQHRRHDLPDPPSNATAPAWFLSRAEPSPSRVASPPDSTAPVRNSHAVPFATFAPRVRLREDAQYLYVESSGLPDHPMMVGITAWQQQVPLPQAYTGANAWRIPLHPRPSSSPIPLRDRFLRGAVALAANGIPIFNPQNNRGEVSADIGELDRWGGHCGRADDYHYHVAPLHLQAVLGPKMPIAVALDGYALFGPQEPDGSSPTGLDVFHGHSTPELGYHYHASSTYPYVNGGFHGEVTEIDGQVDPQPRARPVRESLTALRGATITGFEAVRSNHFLLTYELNGETRSIKYGVLPDGTHPFEFHNGRDGTVTRVYPSQDPDERRPKRAVRPGNERNRSGTPESKAPFPSDAAAPESWNGLKRPNASFVLKSSVITNGGILPRIHTGDGRGDPIPLSWSGAPDGTATFALIMDHLAPDKVVKGYWTLWNIPPGVTTLPGPASGSGRVGTNFKGREGYEPPRSQGPGPKTYVLTLYALSEVLQIPPNPRGVSREMILEAMRGKVLASASLNVVYTREEEADTPPTPVGRRDGVQGPTQPGAARNSAKVPPPVEGSRGDIVKPAVSDTARVSIYADNWFALYLNGKLTAVDSIDFLPHNVVTVDVLPEYPLTIAVMAKDNADPTTGLEYGSHIGDGGFILKFSDGTVTDATWKAKCFFKGPLHREVQNPKVEHLPIPDGWWAVDFDDHAWDAAQEFPADRVAPKAPFYEADFTGAKFIWSADLDLDNTVILRTRIEKPGWKKRWNTLPDLDVSGAPGR